MDGGEKEKSSSLWMVIRSSLQYVARVQRIISVARTILTGEVNTKSSVLLMPVCIR